MNKINNSLLVTIYFSFFLVVIKIDVTNFFSSIINEFGLKTGRTDKFIKTVKIDSSLTID